MPEEIKPRLIHHAPAAFRGQALAEDELARSVLELVHAIREEDPTPWWMIQQMKAEVLSRVATLQRCRVSTQDKYKNLETELSEANLRLRAQRLRERALKSIMKTISTRLENLADEEGQQR